MQSISKSKLKANMLRIFRELEKSGEELIVTDRGRQVLRIQPVSKKKTVDDVFAALRSRVVFRENAGPAVGREKGP